MIPTHHWLELERKTFTMKKSIGVLLVALIVLIFALPGCSRSVPEGPGQPATEAGGAHKTEPAPARTETGGTKPPAGNKAADSYAAYQEAKSQLITRLSDAVSGNPEAGMAMLSFLGITAVDLVMLPAAFLGADEMTMEIGLGMLGAEGFKYDVDGDKSTVTFKDQSGKETVFAGRFDSKAGGSIFTSVVDGREALYSEYRQTPYGYAGQYYIVNDDGSVMLYLLAIEGKDGTVGFEQEATKPEPLSGNEGPDFPKAAKEWYSIKGKQVTGINPDGQELDFLIP